MGEGAGIGTGDGTNETIQFMSRTLPEDLAIGGAAAAKVAGLAFILWGERYLAGAKSRQYALQQVGGGPIQLAMQAQRCLIGSYGHSLLSHYGARIGTARHLVQGDAGDLLSLDQHPVGGARPR